MPNLSLLLSGGLPTLYYATLQLHNNVGKDIELLESNGKEPAHLLTKGEARKIKLIGHEIKHYKFEAIDNSTGEALVLNNQAFASVSLGEDPDRVMEVTISKPSKYEWCCLLGQWNREESCPYHFLWLYG